MCFDTLDTTTVLFFSESFHYSCKSRFIFEVINLSNFFVTYSKTSLYLKTKIKNFTSYKELYFLYTLFLRLLGEVAA